MNQIIRTEQLTKTYRKSVALDQLTLSVPEGSIYAYLGPNGAGKTTTIQLLMNLLCATSGTAEVFGVPSTKLGYKEFQQIGHVSENQQSLEWMTVTQLINYYKPMYPTWDDSFCARLLRLFELPCDQKLENMSRGMKVKAKLLSSLAYRPKLLVLDEPFSGLDPLVRDEFIQGVLEPTEQEGWTIFISSHDIDEVERLADWVGFLNRGVLQLSENRDALQERFRRVEIVVPDGFALPENLPAEWLEGKQAGRIFSFVDSQYNACEEPRYRTIFPGASAIDLQTLSLREIYLTLARHFKGVSK